METEVKRGVGINMAIYMEEEFLLLRVLQNGFQRMPLGLCCRPLKDPLLIIKA